MLHCQFLCYVLKPLFFIKIALKLSYFCKKMQNFRALGTPPPDPRASGGCPAPIVLRRLEAPPPNPKISPPNCEFLATRLVSFWWRPFFCYSLNLLTRKNSARGSSPPMLKIGQNWGKIANYSPPMLNKDLHPWMELCCPGVMTQRWFRKLVTRLGVIQRV